MIVFIPPTLPNMILVTILGSRYFIPVLQMKKQVPKNSGMPAGQPPPEGPLGLKAGPATQTPLCIPPAGAEGAASQAGCPGDPAAWNTGTRALVCR